MVASKPTVNTDRKTFRNSKKGKNWALFGVIVAFCVLLFIITIVRML
jgi:hypothetical protein|tara:strand:- start:7254 stop:7394 length:141 start_codon:yes stop_codon:yes gene_type:complete